MGTVVENIGKRGGEPAGVGDVLQGGGEGSTYFWVRDMGDDPPLNGMGPGGVSVQGGQKDYRETDLAYFRQKMVVTPLDLTMQKLGFEEVEAYATRR